jgi:hypothetical protein
MPKSFQVINGGTIADDIGLSCLDFGKIQIMQSHTSTPTLVSEESSAKGERTVTPGGNLVSNILRDNSNSSSNSLSTILDVSKPSSLKYYMNTSEKQEIYQQ